MSHYSTAHVSDYKQAGILWSYMLIHIGATNLYIVEKMGNPAYQYPEADTAHIRFKMPLKIYPQLTETQVRRAVINSKQKDSYN